MDLDTLAQDVGHALQQRGLMLTTAESCTGGGVAQAITSVAGSSQWFDRGFITYTNLSKQEMLGISGETLARYGAVSEQTVCAMAENALRRSHAQMALAVTGIAGPTGGTAEKPVGTVWFAWGQENREPICVSHLLVGDRKAIRRQAVVTALAGLLRFIQT